MVIFMSTEILVYPYLQFLSRLLFLKEGCQCLVLELPCRPHLTFISHDEFLCRERAHVLFWPLMLWHKYWSTELILLPLVEIVPCQHLESMCCSDIFPCPISHCLGPQSFLQGPSSISPCGWGLWGLLFMVDKDVLLSHCRLSAGECQLLWAACEFPASENVSFPQCAAMS